MKTTAQLDLATLADHLRGGEQVLDDSLFLTLGECTLRLRSNSRQLMKGLADYFAHVVSGPVPSPDIDLVAIERDAPELEMEFIDWAREPGKTGRKDSYLDLAGGRLIRKVRTGMVFLQSATHRIAAGPCVEYDNQVINFINSQYMNWLQHRDWLICHAAGLVRNRQAFGIAGFSGGGKSTLMLQLLAQEDVCYLTNDRLFVRLEEGRTQAVGIPKLPRINPGTIVHNPQLHDLIPAAERKALLQMPPQELWELEEKYDVHVERIYGPNRIVPRARLHSFLVLNWQREAETGLVVEPVDLAKRRDLLAAIMKSPGPFYQYPDGSFFQDDTPFDEQRYLDAFRDVRVYEARGKVDFPAMTRHCLERLMS